MPRTPIPQPEFLPMSRAEMDRLGWDELDVLLVTGDAYVDHPSFGAPLIGRWLAANGYRAGIVAQPAWESPEALLAMGRPRLFAGITAGSLDSMLAHYTAFRKKRSDDAYTPGGKAGARPNRAAIVYANLARRAFPGLPVVLGGIEASLRRASHYDFWSDSLRRSILLDAKATAVLYGMAEHSVLALAEALERAREEAGEGGDLRPVLACVPGAVWAGGRGDLPPGADVLELASHEAILAEPGLLVEATALLERHVHQDRQTAVQPSGDRLVIMNPPGRGLEGEALDALYALPFSRAPHPSYKEAIPAASMIEGSLNIHRGCAGGCSFCTLALHQGRRIRSRSAGSVLAEAARLADLRRGGASVSDVGGPSANMWGAWCGGDMASCRRPSCLTPRPCRHFRADQRAFVALLRAVRKVPGVRGVRVASGWRMDLGLLEPEALGAMVREFTGGQAKVAPEHVSARVLGLMRKPGVKTFERFLELFGQESARAGKEQYVVPYLMSAHPGCTDEDMRELSRWLAGRGWKPTQVQCFIPLPGTMAAAMFFSGLGPEGKPVHVARTDAERLRQHAILAPDHREAPAGAPGRPARPREAGSEPAGVSRRGNRRLHGQAGRSSQENPVRDSSPGQSKHKRPGADSSGGEPSGRRARPATGGRGRAWRKG